MWSVTSEIRIFVYFRLELFLQFSTLQLQQKKNLLILLPHSFPLSLSLSLSLSLPLSFSKLVHSKFTPTTHMLKWISQVPRYIYIYIYICKYISVYTHIYMHSPKWVNTSKFMSLYIYIYIYTQLHMNEVLCVFVRRERKNSWKMDSRLTIQGGGG